MSEITLDKSKIGKFISEDEIGSMESEVLEARRKIAERNGAGSEMLGWVDLPVDYNREEFERIKRAAGRIQRNSEILVVIGIGGSYLGARAVIDALSGSFPDNEKLKVYFAGNNISGSYLNDLVSLIKDKDFSVNVISKSGTTTESAIAFRLFKKILEEKYGKDGARERIYATTDKEKGALKDLAIQEGYETFVVPDNVGGRYSVLTAVGLLPIAVAGISIDNLMAGAADGRLEYDKNGNTAEVYSSIRNILYRKGKKVEILVNFEPNLHYFSEWWKQLFGESEGKDSKGIFPAAVDFSTDLHSMGQYIQEGERHLFETILFVEKCEKDVEIPEMEGNLDGLDYLLGKSLNYINKKAMEATVSAHTDGGVPNLIISIPELNPYYIGKLIYFFEKACAISSYILGVNPFNQPGVEAYKNNMYALLRKPGYESRREELEKRI